MEANSTNESDSVWITCDHGAVCVQGKDDSLPKVFEGPPCYFPSCIEAAREWWQNNSPVTAFPGAPHHIKHKTSGTQLFDPSLFKMNLLQLESVQQLCSELGIELDDIAHIHASPPCQTFAAPDPTNSTKCPPCHFRDPKDPLRGPRQSPPGCPYRLKAILHDGLVKKILELLDEALVAGGMFHFTMENPRAALRRRDYMQIDTWPETLKAVLRTVDYCAFGYPYRKATDIWTSLLNWTPTGQTGSGRCERKCASGSWYMDEHGNVTYRHHLNLAQDPKDGLRGKGAKKFLNSLPSELTEEFLSLSLASWREEHTDDRQPVLLDLCSGYGSLREVAEKLGYKYVGVDVRHLS